MLPISIKRYQGKKGKMILAGALLIASIMLILLNQPVRSIPSEPANNSVTPTGTSELFQEKHTDQLVPYQGAVEHIFFHPLIIYPELAFDQDKLTKGYNDFFITINEFNKIINDLYNDNFILVDINDIYKIQQEGDKTKYVKSTLYLPPGKKPLVISIDDLNYYKYMRENGNAYKLVLDKEGNVATYSKNLLGQEIIANDNEVIPLLDKFVAEHPDFSYHGAKGVIALTGYAGVLGYRTNRLGEPEYEQEKTEALRVIARLKQTGWTFASHGYAHKDATKISLEVLQRDTEQWRSEVGSLVGATSVYVFPYGSHLAPSDPRFRYLVNAGFNVLCSVGSSSWIEYGSDYLRMDRRHIDGIALHEQRKRFLDLFDSSLIIDKVRPAVY